MVYSYKRSFLFTHVFLNFVFQLSICSQIWKTIPDIGPQMCSVECVRYNGNCKQAQYDFNKLRCNLMTVEDLNAAGALSMSAIWINELPGSIKKVADGCSRITCYSYYLCDVTTTTNESTCTELDCPKGYYRGNNDCRPCSPGYYQDKEGQYGCNKCPAGTYNPHWGSSGCYNCGLGHYQPSSGQTSCHQCGEGHYQNNSRQTGCKQCDEGHYADATGMWSCHKCPVGQKQPDTGQSECIDCNQGRYQDEVGKKWCKKCSVGTYQDETGQGSCKPCLTAVLEGASICIVGD